MDQKIIAEYLKRSYFAVDGLWFVILEHEYSLDEALKMDEKVWRILPKIQARKAKELLGISDGGLDDLMRALEIKLEAEGYSYSIDRPISDHANLTIDGCPWYNILKKSGREHLSEQIADIICTLEFRVWLKEFGENLTISFGSRFCSGADRCCLEFRSE